MDPLTFYSMLRFTKTTPLHLREIVGFLTNDVELPIFELDLQNFPRLLTVGHSNHQPDAFLKLLHAFKIKELVDVGSIPSSGKFPHFRTLSGAWKQRSRGWHLGFAAAARGQSCRSAAGTDGRGGRLAGVPSSSGGPKASVGLWCHSEAHQARWHFRGKSPKPWKQRAIQVNSTEHYLEALKAARGQSSAKAAPKSRPAPGSKGYAEQLRLRAEDVEAKQREEEDVRMERGYAALQRVQQRALQASPMREARAS